MSKRERTAKYLQLLHALTSELSGTTGFESIYETVLNILQQAPAVTGSVILIVDSEDNVNYRNSRALPDTLGEQIAALALGLLQDGSGRGYVIPDLIEENDHLAEVRRAALAAEIRALALIPLQSKSRLIGGLVLCYDTPHPFDEAEMQFVEGVAAYVTAALSREYVARELKDARQWMARGIEDRTVDRLVASAGEHVRKALHQEAAFVSLLQRVAVTANEAETVEDAFRFTLDILCEYTGWPVGHVYMMSADGPPRLEPTDIWHLKEPDRYERFQQMTQQTVLDKGVGLPGRVLASGRPAWITDVSVDHNFPRAKLATDIGMGAGFAFPVLVGREVAAVLEFFVDHPLQPDDALLDLVGHIGTQLGRVVERARAARRMQQSEARFRSIVESALHAIILANEQGQVVSWNKSAEEIFGYTTAEVMGQSLSVLMPERYRERHETGLERYNRTGESRVLGRLLELEGLRKDGTEFPMELSLTSWETEEGRFYGGMIQDITERRASEQTIRRLLRLSEQLNATLELEALLEILLIEVVELVGAVGGLSGIRTFDGTPIGRLYRKGQLHSLDNESLVSVLDWLSDRNKPVNISVLAEFEEPCPDFYTDAGITALLRVPLLSDNGHIMGFFEVHDKTTHTTFSTADQEKLMAVSQIASIAVQNAQLVIQLRTISQRLRELSRRVVSAQEEERQRLSRELHDSAGQILTTLLINLKLLDNSLSEEQDRLRKQVATARELATAAYEEIRSVSHALRPPALEMVGLNQTLEAFSQDFAHQTQLDITYKGAELPGLSDQISISFYRFLQETLANVAKHARATHVSVTLHHEDGELALSVEDNGIGFQPVPGTLNGLNRRGGVGLLGLRERFELLSGEVSVHSRPGQGTRVTARCEVTLAPELNGQL